MIPCPACSGENRHDAIFCEHCHKALGPFRYVKEELNAQLAPHEKLADRVTDFIGQPHFVVVHLLWFALWIFLNTGIVAIVRRFDVYPYNLLATVLAVEAIFITGFILITQNRQQLQAEKYAELDYEVNVRSYREICEVKKMLEEMQVRLVNLERAS
ncbi:DUF1003 domain-containing protein [Armatimonas sp.]|uniref:DUF1003 domain-containing protein n=1 Tax=Armatimonas sp. TaxID=1872638 RepID=UPI00286B1F3E|nr:DUF1003 domain-containing protein [Armatimonas sp.]